MLNLDMLKQYQSPLAVRHLKPVTNAIEDNELAYQETWTKLTEFELYSKITSGEKLSCQQEFPQGQLFAFILDKEECRLRVTGESAAVALTLKNDDIMILSPSPIEIDPQANIQMQLKQLLKTNLYN